MRLKTVIRNLLPKQFIGFYHWSLAKIAAAFYGFPSNKLVVIGVTGTSGKSTTVQFLGQMLEAAGKKIGWATTVSFKVGDKEWINEKKMTMLGRFQTQKLLQQMVVAGCEYAIVETTSQGVVQFRHVGINYDVAVFTNLWPEHIESHGGFENYKKAKGKFFEFVTKSPVKKLAGKEIHKAFVVNIDNEHAPYFLSLIKGAGREGTPLRSWRATAGREGGKGAKRGGRVIEIMSIKFFEGSDYKQQPFKGLIPSFYTEPYKRYIEEETELVKKVVLGKRNILEAGVGIGRTIQFIAPCVEKMVGIDIADRMLDEAQEVAKQYSNVEIRKLAIETIGSEFSKGFFDVSLCLWNTLGNVDDEVAALRAINDVTNETIFVTVFFRGTLKLRKELYKAIGVEMDHVDEETETFYSKSGLRSRSYRIEDLEKIANEANLKVVNHGILGGVVLWVLLKKQ